MANIVRKEVQIRRKELGGELLTVEVRNQRRLWLSSEYSGAAPLRGLTPQEEEKYLLPHLGLQPNDPLLGQKLLNFWKDLTIEVDVAGVVLDISTIDGEPINIMDWIKWKWALKHSKVKASKAEMDSDPKAWFYIYDPDEETKRESSNIQRKTAATIAYSKLDAENNQKLMRHILINCGVDVRSLNDSQVKITLYNELERDPEKFLKLSTDKDLQWKARILEMVSLQILRKSNNSFIYVDEIIGYSIDEAVRWFKDPANSQQVTTIGAQYKEKVRDASAESALPATMQLQE